MGEDDLDYPGGPLSPDGVNTVVELMIVLTEALKERDVEKVLTLRRRTQDWLQMDDERDAQADLLDAAAELIEDYRAHADAEDLEAIEAGLISPN